MKGLGKHYIRDERFPHDLERAAVIPGNVQEVCHQPSHPVAFTTNQCQLISLIRSEV
jgi:hypothetical protein